MSDADELAALRHEVATLRTLVETLTSELRGAQNRADLTMRNHHRCTACGHRRIAHALTVLDRADGDTRQALALNRPSWWSSKVQGEMEAFVCTACGLVEWWVKQPDALSEQKDLLVIIDGETGPSGPYR